MHHAAMKLGIPVALMAGGFGFCLLVLELGLRGAGYDPMADLASGRAPILQESANPLRQYELTPHASGPAWGTHVYVNSYGMRDREYPVRRTGAPRVLVLGDSVTFGNGLAPEQRFTDLLEQRLSRRFERPVEVLNFGIGGYDTVQEVATLEEVGLQFAPDLVVLAYCVNDVADNSPNLDYIHSLREVNSLFYRLRSFQLVRSTVDRLRLTWRFTSDNRADLLDERYRDRIEAVSEVPGLGSLREELSRRLATDDDPDYLLPWYQSDAHLGKIEYSLGRLRKLSLDSGFPVLGAILPYLGEDESYDTVYQMIERMMRAQGLETIVLATGLPATGLEELRILPFDPIHPNARGQELIAQALERRVAELLPQGADR